MATTGTECVTPTVVHAGRAGVGRGDDDLAAAVRAGDAAAFATLVARHGEELRAHCYRILRSRPEAEDVVQETFLRAWRSRDRFEGRSSHRTWLYRIATNACLDTRRRWSRRVDATAAGPGGPSGCGSGDAGGLDPAIEAVPATDDPPDAAVVAREAVEVALLATIQHLPARQRAVLILRDVLGWSAHDSAALLGTTVPAANSALQRARATMHGTHPSRRPGRSPRPATRGQRALLATLVDAHDRADAPALATLQTA